MSNHWFRGMDSDPLSICRWHDDLGTKYDRISRLARSIRITVWNPVEIYNRNSQPSGILFDEWKPVALVFFQTCVHIIDFYAYKADICGEGYYRWCT